MADEQTAIAPTEQATEPAIVEAPEQVEESVNLEAEQAEEETTTELTEEELEEFEWNGKPIRGPKGLKDGVLMQADYTKKTQEVAETRKALEARQAELDQQAKATEDDLRERAQLVNIDDQLAEYAKLTPADWDTHHANDPMGTDRAWRHYQMLQQERAKLAQTVEGRKTERTAKAQQEFAKRVQETKAFAEKEIKGWSPELSTKVFQYAKEEGVPASFLEANMSPTLIKLLHRAYVGTESLKKATALPNPNPSAPKPLTIVGGKSSPAASTNLAEMDMDAYVAARQRGVGGKKLA